MIAALLPYLKRTLEAKTDGLPWYQNSLNLLLPPCGRCLLGKKSAFGWNKTDEMLNLAISGSDACFALGSSFGQTVRLNLSKKLKLKRNWSQDSLSTVKTAVSSIKTCKSQAKIITQMAAPTQSRTSLTNETQTVMSRMSTITQLTEQVFIYYLPQ